MTPLEKAARVFYEKKVDLCNPGHADKPIYKWGAASPEMRAITMEALAYALATLMEPGDEVLGIDTRWNGADTYPENNMFIWQAMLKKVIGEDGK